MSEQHGLIVRRFNEVEIRQRPADRYLDATAMCRAAGKQWKHYHENKGTRDYIAALSESVGIPTDSLVEARPSRGGGTFVHPLIAVHLAQWLSPAFAVQVATWTEELLTTGRVELAPPSTPGEVALAMAQAVVALERRQAESDRRHDDADRRLSAIETERDDARRALLALPPPLVPAPETATRDLVRQHVNGYCLATGTSQQTAYRVLYERLYYDPPRFNARLAAQRANCSQLEAVESAGYIELLYSIAKKHLPYERDGRIEHHDT